MNIQEDLDVFFYYKNWAVVGDVLNPNKYANKIYERFKARGYTVFGVNPRDTKGTIYNNLSSIDDKIEAIDLCINSIQGLEIIKEAKLLGINKVLIQPGAASGDILEFCRNNGIIAIEGCALVYFSNSATLRV